MSSILTGHTFNVRSDSTKEVSEMAAVSQVHSLAEDCRVAQRMLFTSGDEVPQWISMTALIEDQHPGISEAARDLWARCGWKVKP